MHFIVIALLQFRIDQYESGSVLAGVCLMYFETQSKHHTFAFSLIELLVVIAVIALIMSLLVPALSGLAQRGRIAKDLLQLRGLQQAHAAYATDHRDYFADAGLSHGGSGNEEFAWINTLEEYYDNKLVVRSPLDESLHWAEEDGGQGVPIPGSTDRFRQTSYGWNNYLSRNYSPAAAIDPTQVTDRLSKITNQAMTVHFLHMAFEGEYAGSDHVHVETWWISDTLPDAPPLRSASQMQTNAARGREALWTSASNYGFVDGHTETLHFSEVYLNLERNRFNPKSAALVVLHSDN